MSSPSKAGPGATPTHGLAVAGLVAAALASSCVVGDDRTPQCGAPRCTVDASLDKVDARDQGTSEVLTSCPSTFDPGMMSACQGSFSCTYGSETCCGKTYPATICRCEGSRMSCGATDACLGKGICTIDGAEAPPDGGLDYAPDVFSE